MKKNGTLKKCGTCKIAHEMSDMACCDWYMDNVVCGDKTTEDCTEYIPCDKEKGGVTDKYVGSKLKGGEG